MPVLPNPERLIIWPHQLDIPVTSGMFITTTIASNGEHTEQQLDAVLQDLLDYMQAWPGRNPQQDVRGQRYRVDLYTVTTNNPIPPPDPPEEG